MMYIGLRKALPVLAFMLLVGRVGLAQDLFIPYDKAQLSGVGKEKLKADVAEFENKKAFKQTAKKQYWLSVPDLQLAQQATISFTLPGTKRKLSFRATHVDMSAPKTFRWSGDLVDGFGTIALLCDAGRLHGYMQLGTDSYQFYALQEGLTMLVENDLTTNIKGDCGTTSKRGQSQSDSPPKAANGRRASCSDNIRVLFVFTQEAQAAVGNINDLANQCVNQFNTAITDSRANIGPATQITAANVLPVTFNQNNSGAIGDDVTELVDSQQIKDLRDQNRADVVCLLTNANYTNAPGATPNNQIPATNAGAYLIAEVSTAALAGRYTFAHEMGHLLGGRHDDDTNPPAYSHGFRFSAYTNGAQSTPDNFTTLMHRFINLAFEPRVLRYANPDATYGLSNTPTGTAGNNDVARRIRETAQSLVEFRPSLDNAINTQIDGPTTTSLNRYLSLEAVYGCSTPSSFEWSIGPQPFANFTYTATGENLSLYITSYFANQNASSSGQMFVRLRTTFPGGYIATNYLVVYINRNGGRIGQEEPIEPLQIVKISPNPTSGEVKLIFTTITEAEARIDLIDAQGRLVVSREEGVLPAGTHERIYSHSNLISGTYIYRVRSGRLAMAQKFIITN